MSATRVHLESGSPILRAGLEAILRADGRFEIAADREAADVLLLDQPADDDGAEAPDQPTVVLSDGHAAELLRRGYQAVLPREPVPAELIAALLAAAAGLITLDRATFTAISTERLPTTALAQPLTRREVEVLRLLADGLGNKEIATRLHISEHTVKFHVAAILEKMQAGSRAEAVAIGMRSGLILL